MTTQSLPAELIPVQSVPQDPEQIQGFFNQSWQVYQKLLRYNYMGHQQIYHLLHNLLVNRFRSSFSLLDLGCGDAQYMARSLRGTLVNHYQGVDLSEVALAIAQENLANLPMLPSLQQANLLDFVQTCPQQFDIIFTSFALHHLSPTEKQEFIAQLPRILKPGGLFILVDVFRRSGESRTGYLQRYFRAMQENWTELTAAELELATNHIRSSDFPEPVSLYEAMAQNQGFARVECLYRHVDQASQLLCFYR